MLRSMIFAGLLLAVPAQAQDPVVFNRDVRSLLSDRCFQCHGFDRQARKADLRLDTWEGLTRSRDGRTPVVPGDPERSELVSRIESTDQGVVMPPPGSGLRLTEGERKLLRRWIAEGAEFAPHWAFVPPTEPATPDVAGRRARNPVDHFVIARLQERSLSLSPQADRETLARRASLDVTGLPPTPEEVDAFLADRSPMAYEKLVDRLLASPHFGERMALVWLDAARYADTNGFHHDNIRTAWPYRDWVIAAFNDNLPFDRFVVEQLAGDLLPEPTEGQRIATAFCRMHNINDEGGALDEEYRVEAVCDRIETIATTFMGLTLTCARCHDHKYDPLTQEDYYSLYAFFNSVEERGVYPNNSEQARAYPARLPFRTDEQKLAQAAAEARLRSAAADLKAAAPAIDRERQAWEEDYRRQRGVHWVATEIVAATAAESEVEILADGSVRARSKPQSDTLTIELRTAATDLRLLRLEALTDPAFGGRVGVASNGNAVVTAVTAEAVSEKDPERRTPIEWRWAWADHEQPNGDYDVMNLVSGTGHGWALEGHGRAAPRTAVLLATRPFGFSGGTVVRVTIACKSRYGQHVLGRPRVSLGQADGDLSGDFPVVTGDWWLAGPFPGRDFDTVYHEHHGPESIAALDPGQKFGKIGWRHRPDLADGVVHALRGERAAFYFARTLHSPVARTLALSLGSDDAIRLYLNGAEVLANKVRRGAAPDQNQVTVALRPGANILVVKIVNDGGPGGLFFRAAPGEDAPGRLTPAALIPRKLRDPVLDRGFVEQWSRERSPTYAALEGRVDDLQSELAALSAQAVPVVVMVERDEPTKTHVLARGSYDGADEQRPVTRRPPSALGGTLPPGAPDNRLGFARWLTHRDHPLTARVHINRLWQTLFGIGLVKTTENFGQQSDWPSHPALLDWLAVRLQQTGWDQKALLRLILTSATYRQSATVRPDAKAVDPENRLLAYFPRRRLSGELVRDQALFVSGLLVQQIGGPSVRPYQPPGLWREVSIGGSSNTQVFRRDAGQALYRRSLYTFWKRTSPSPQMTTFDAPTREFCVVRRGTTNTPLQALVLWNDVQFVEAARALAARTLREQPDDTTRLESMFRRCTGRRPDSGERAILRHTLEQFTTRYAAAPDDARALLATGESPAPKGPEIEKLAAWTMVANALLCLDETIVRD